MRRGMIGLFAALAVLLSAVGAWADRHALIIGNGAYDELQDLENALADAQAYRDAFDQLGFRTSFHTDLTLDETLDAFDVFLARVSPGDEVALVYSGHGWSDGAINYLTPVDAPKQASDRKLQRSSIVLRDGHRGLLDELESAGVSLTVAIIDACRNNPFDPPQGTRSASLARGLAPISAPQGTFIIFSAGVRQEALDRLPSDPASQQLSVFTRTFLPQLLAPISLEDAIARAQVETARLALEFNGHQQHPAYYDQTLGETCLHASCDGEAVLASIPPSVETPGPGDGSGTGVPDVTGIVPTLIVDATGGGDFREIADAVASARPGTRIEIRPGRYTKGVKIDQPVDLVGVGDRGAILWEVSGDNVIEWSASRGSIRNLTIRQMGGQYFAVNFIGGSAEFIGNDVSSMGLASVAIRDDAAPTVQGNRIHDGAQGGVFVLDGGKGLIEDNVIEGNTLAGIEMRGGGSATIRGNTVRNGKAGGIFIHQETGGLVERNLVEANALAGIEVKDGASPTIRGNTVRNGQQSGIYIHNGASGLIEDNLIEGNRLAGIEIKVGATPTVRNNTVRNGQAGGIYIYDGAQGLIEGNIVENSGLAGIEIKTGATPTVRGNTVRGSNQGGMYIHDDAGGLIEDNVVENSTFAGIEIKDGADPMVRGNTVRNGQQGGVYVHDNGRGTIEDNLIEGNGLAGVEIKSGATPLVRNNTIRNGTQSGVFVHEGGRGVIEGNVIEGNGYHGVEITTGAAPDVRGNTISGNAYYAIKIVNGGSGSITGNDLRGNSAGPMQIGSDAGKVYQADNRM